MIFRDEIWFSSRNIFSMQGQESVHLNYPIDTGGECYVNVEETMILC